MKAIKRLEEIKREMKLTSVHGQSYFQLNIEKQGILLALEDIEEIIYKEQFKENIGFTEGCIDAIQKVRKMIKQSEKFK